MTSGNPLYESWSLDLVTVSFSGELLSLKLQARSLAKFVREGTFDTIWVIVNDSDFRGFKSYFKLHVLPEYGVHSDRVELIDGKVMAGRKIPKNGWRSQQPLKLLAARIVDSQQYLILDSKNHFVKPFDQSRVIAPDGKLISHSYPVIEGFVANYRNACRYFGAPVGSEQRPRVMPTATPYMIATQQAVQLLDYVEDREKRSFFDFFLATKSYTEFYFYDAYLRSKTGVLHQLYEMRSKPNVTLFANHADKPVEVEKAVSRLQDEEIAIFGVHRKVFEVANEDVLRWVAQVWCGIGLVQDVAEAKRFMRPGTPFKKRVLRLF